MEQNNLEFSTLICVCTENATAYPRQARTRVVFQSSIAIDIWTHVFKTGRAGLGRVTLPPRRKGISRTQRRRISVRLFDEDLR